jgi:hypothetical protein
MSNTPDSPAKMPDDRTTQGGNYWTLFTPGIWKVLHAVLHKSLPQLRRLRQNESILLGGRQAGGVGCRWAHTDFRINPSVTASIGFLSAVAAYPLRVS